MKREEETNLLTKPRALAVEELETPEGRQTKRKRDREQEWRVIQT